MPTVKQMEAASKHKLVSRIQQLGGVKKVAASMQLTYLTALFATPTAAFEALAEYVHTFVRQHSLPEDEMPSFKRLRQAQQHELAGKIQQHGGLRRLASHMGVKRLAPPRVHKRLELVVADVQAFVEHQVPAEHKGNMPTVDSLKQAGQHSLAVLVCRHGSKRVARAAGLQFHLQVQLHLYSKDLTSALVTLV